MTSRAFWLAAAERAAKTFAQVLALMLVGDMVAGTGFDILAADWPQALSYAAGGALLSVLSSVASHKASGDGPSLTNAEHVTNNPRRSVFYWDGK